MTAASDLDRFVQAQAVDGTYARALSELKGGRKRSHWMWFVFPQLRGLGLSPTAQHYGIASREEARAYLGHPLLGPRLRDCTQATLAIEGVGLEAIFGSPDDLKFRSSMTVFGRVAGPDDGLFRQALARFCEGHEDPRTLDLLARDADGA